MRKTPPAVPAALVALAATTLAAGESGGPVTLGTLLHEMTDRHAIARWPDPAYASGQLSSYDRASIVPGNDDWWANRDIGNFLRREERDGRVEHVMMDADGPGAVVRIWAANPPADATIRVYVDRAEEPVIETSATTLLGGDLLGGPPLAEAQHGGWSLFTPIPYAEHCKITCDAEEIAYHVNYRTYDRGTNVVSFSWKGYEAALGQLRAALQALRQPYPTSTGNPSGLSAYLRPREGHGFDLEPGPRAVHFLSVTFSAEDFEKGLRSTVIKMEFDGRRTVWCPLGDFFGIGIGLNEHTDWCRIVRKTRYWRDTGDDVAMVGSWIMPYRDSARISVANEGHDQVRVHVSAGTQPWTWDDRSMHFHTAWRQESPLLTQPRRDWSVIRIDGRGVLVGDTLSVVNPARAWWGDGDERIYVDDEPFPSHFGTGTNHYYGFAEGGRGTFSSPLHSLTRRDDPGHDGHTTATRLRLLDAIPFERSLRMDLEVWHQRLCHVGYASAVHFYAVPPVTHDVAPMPAEASRGVVTPPPPPPLTGPREDDR